MTTETKSTYIPVIGLEIHAELKTRTKMFCDCLNDSDEKQPNTNICPICLGHPGTLPAMNKKAIEHLLKVGTALSGDIPASSKFDRKNYFYPDLPKGYQISQYDIPFVFGGILKGVSITRIHLEEDTGRLQHGKNKDGSPVTLVDYNRAGVPLMELVTEPDIRQVSQIGEFARELQRVLRYLDVSDADMEKGQMRVEVNLSLGQMKDGQLVFGTKVEVKNIASFKMAEAAAEYEIKRQRELLEKGEEVRQETRGWDDIKKMTVSQRFKETSADYRYFPEPDLPALDISQFDFKKIKEEMPELPQQKRLRFEKEFGINQEDIETLINNRSAARFFEEAVSELKTEPVQDLQRALQLSANYLLSDVLGSLAEKGIDDIYQSKLDPENFADLIVLIESGTINSRSAKNILALMLEKGGDPREIVASEGMEQISDKAQLSAALEKVIEANADAVAKYKGGNEKLLMFFVGKVMGELGGKADPKALQELVKERLSG
ncbi:MAG: Asp-tRNA(Asn)/Glu-tRNA(Gln) amidotransferase subunit GatB [Candidatus Harrisonbacteria bacterium]|nr:Asp-tRNA(Asn)/Glu-tRNA(Gln) amidotransferase subunit GatB [Candidatus Harrisonbacteria bacterium]